MEAKARCSACTAAVLLALLGLKSAAAADTEYDMRLTIELTPDVPNASDEGFLSSLLSNHPDYRLDLLQLDDPSRIELELTGPGPVYLCQGVVETMRKDARVLSIHVDSAASPAIAASGTGSMR
jgi:hypothetical protein